MLGSLCDTLDVYDYNDITSRVKCYKVSSLGMLFQVGLGREKQNRREEKQAILVQDGLSASLSASIHRFNQQKVKTNWKKLNQYWMWTDSFSLHYCINNTGLQFFTLHFRGFRHHKMSDDDLEHTRKYVQILHKYYAILCEESQHLQIDICGGFWIHFPSGYPETTVLSAKQQARLLYIVPFSDHSINLS